ncbi:MAG TPA: SDR family oxidoreductase [Bauldia sp.]|nr:SDR family oxidoreductase [Bauldia sp.]
MNRLEGRKALVIGGSTGIGREVCRLFATEGADVVVGDFGHAADKASLIAEIGAIAPGRQADSVEVDVTVEQQVADAVAFAVDRLGRIDILVNNAGIGGIHQPIQDETSEHYDRMLAVTLKGAWLGMKYAVPHMLQRGDGRIINTASQLAHKPSPLNASYCAAKAGVVALTVSTALELAETGIRVNAVCPGATQTPMWAAGDKAWCEWKANSLPIKRVAQPIEIAWAYVYLASEEASYMIGQSISPNGGDICW